MNLAIFKWVIYSRPAYEVSTAIASGGYHLSRLLPMRSFVWIFLTLARIQLEIGFNTEQLAYSRKGLGNAGNFARLKKLEERILRAVDLVRPEFQFHQHVGNLQTTVLFAASFVYHVGGHTRLLQTYLSQLHGSRLYARFERRGPLGAERQGPNPATLFEGRTDLFISGRQQFFLLKRQVQDTYRTFQSLSPACIVMFNQTVDLGLLLAAILYSRQNPQVPVIYYHHADDYFPFLCGAFECHIDIDANQDAKCRHIRNRELIRISVRDRFPEVSQFSEGLCETAFTVFSFVHMGKIVDSAGRSPYVELVARICKMGFHVVLATNVGSASLLSEKLATVGCDMSLITIDEACLDIAKYAGKIHVCLDTFPVGGGMSVIDGLSMRLPVIIHDAPRHQIFRDNNLAHWMFVDEPGICSYLSRLSQDGKFYADEAESAYAIFKQYYSQEVMSAALLSVVSKVVRSRERDRASD